MSTLAKEHLDLVVKTVRGMTPIREYATPAPLVAQAREHLQRLRASPPKEVAEHPMFVAMLDAGPELLAHAWARMSPAALTMCGEASVRHLLGALETIVAEGVPGDLLEAGVWRGGLPIIMRAFLRVRDLADRRVWVADSFVGLPSAPDDPRDRVAYVLMEPIVHLAVSRAEVEQAFAFFGLLDAQVCFLEGWFADTLARAPIERLALIRLDGDFFESTMTSLEALYPKLSRGGYLIVDDYNLPLGCKDAVDEYRARHGISAPMESINPQAVFWRK